MNVNLIHRPCRDNVVLDTLNRREGFQTMSTTQTLRLIYKGKGNSQRKIREGYINNPKAQRLLGELCKGKALKEVKLLDGLLKYKQNWLYVPQSRLRLLVLKEEHDKSNSRP